MRWQRLFEELEGQVEHEHARERDALVDELREGEWSQIAWTHLLADGTEVDVVVLDVGPLRGTVQFANPNVIHLASPTAEHVIATSAVVSTSAEGRPATVSPVLASLGWAHVLRSVPQEPVRFALVGGQWLDGHVDVVGADFVRLRTAGGAVRLLPFSALRMMTTTA